MRAIRTASHYVRTALCADEKVSGFGPTFFEKKVAKKLLIAWFEQSRHKFSIKHGCFIGFEASIPPLRASTTVGIAPSKLRKIKSGI